MSSLNAGISSATYKIGRFSGLNESAADDTGLEPGEASAIENFRVTDSGALKTRPGTLTEIGLLNGYTTQEAGEKIFLTEKNETSNSLTMYPNISVSTSGALSLSGTAITVKYANAASAVGYYFKSGSLFYRFSRCAAGASASVSGGTKITGGYVKLGTQISDVRLYGYYSSSGYVSKDLELYPNISVSNGEIVLSGTSVIVDPYASKKSAATISSEYYGYYFTATSGSSVGTVFEVISATTADDGDDELPWYYTVATIRPVSYMADDTYIWYSKQMSAVSSGSGNTMVKALWSGKVMDEEIVAAACSGHLWKLKKSGSGWTRTDIGSIDTTGRVGLFGMDKKLYILDGKEYRVWNGTSMTVVEGYVPCVVTATAPSGGGTVYESLNKLTLKRRQRFSADGTATTYKLAEKYLSSIDSVKIGGLLTSAYSYNLTNGTVTFTTAPAKGASNVEIAYTKSLSCAETFSGNGSALSFTLSVPAKSISKITKVTVDGTATTAYTLKDNIVTFSTAPADKAAVVIYYTSVNPRTEVVGKVLSEFYNGTTDGRVFIYGDGTNEAFYSGLTEEGKPTAEYFPDLNEMEVGEANSPLTALVRHYSRLLAFKKGEAYSIFYSAVSLDDGVLTAGFYLTPVNRLLGSEAYGQAVIVENRPRTLDGTDIYEWISSSTGGNITNDSRNAKRISGKAEKTLAGFDFDSTMLYYDKLRHEFYAVCGGRALVQNTETGAWYVYSGFDAVCMVQFDGELYFGDSSGNFVLVSEEINGDNGADFSSSWVSGSLDFGKSWQRKYSPVIWMGIKPESGSELVVTADTESSEPVSAGLSAPENGKPDMVKVRLKMKKFTFCRLRLESRNRVTVTGMDMRVKFTGDVM